MEGLLPKIANDNCWVNTKKNGGLITCSINQEGVKQIKLISGIGSNPSVFELSMYCNYSVIFCLVYIQGSTLSVSNSQKGGNSTFKIVFKNDAIYVATDTTTALMSVGIKSLYGNHQFIMAKSDDDLTSPNKMVEL